MPAAGADPRLDGDLGLLARPSAPKPSLLIGRNAGRPDPGQCDLGVPDAEVAHAGSIPPVRQAISHEGVMNVLHAIYTRRSVRAFTREPVDDADIADLIDAAVQAPNAVNAQPWGFTVVTAPTLLKRIAAEAKASALTRLHDAPEQAGLIRHLAQPDFDVLYGAPALVVIWTTGAGDMATHDCCLAAENLMLAAHAKGFGTCWIGFVEPWLQRPEAKAALDLPPEARPVAPIILGYPEAEPAPPGRRPAEVRWVR